MPFCMVKAPRRRRTRAPGVRERDPGVLHLGREFADGEPAGTRSRLSGASSVPKTSGVFTSWPAPSLPSQAGDFQVKR